MKKVVLFVVFLFITKFSYSQNIFPEKFSGCVTDHFALESDSLVAKTDVPVFIKTIISSLDAKSKSKIKGILSLQIIVDMDGNSCLISIKNDTNIKSSKFELKEIIDETIKWNNPSKKVSPLIQLKFNSNSVQYIRLGINAKKGNHIIEEYEIPIEF